ncbi:MAG: hypothetical protein ACLP0J_15305 [Solirubrobacteraceae bacterium]
MTDVAHLERRYRRLLASYPKAFRREQEDEMLVALMAGAKNGWQRPGLTDSADLIRNARLCDSCLQPSRCRRRA